MSELPGKTLLRQLAMWPVAFAKMVYVDVTVQPSEKKPSESLNRMSTAPDTSMLSSPGMA